MLNRIFKSLISERMNYKRMKHRIFFFVVVIILFSACSVLHKTNNQYSSKNDKQAKEYFLDAMKQKILDNPVKAQDLLTKALDISPNHAPANYEMAKIEAGFKRYNTALEYVEKAVKVDRENKWYRILQAEMLEKAGIYLEAIRIYDRLIKSYPKNPDYYMHAAYIHIKMGDYKKAIVYYDKLEEIVGVSKPLSYQKKKLYLQFDDVDGAISEMENLIENFPYEVNYYNIIANQYLEADRIEEAKKTYEKILELAPEDPYIHINIADFYNKTNQTEKSFSHLKKGFANKKLDLQTKIRVMRNYYSISEMYYYNKTQSIALAQILVETHPDKEEAHSLFADFLYKDNKIEKAQKQFERAIEINQAKFFNWETLLNIYMQQQNYTLLKQKSILAQELFPMQATPYFFEGIAEMQTKDYLSAKEALLCGNKLVYNNKPLKTQFFIYIAEVYHELKEYKESDVYFNKALALDPENSYVLNNYSYYLSLRKENLEKAEEYAKKALLIDRENPNNQDTYGWVLYNLKRYEEAKEWIFKSLNSSEKPSGVVLEHYGDVLFMLGKKNEAVEYWKRAKNAGGASKNINAKIELKKIIEPSR